jgi:YVTN family beta-propeller protein
VEKRGRLLAVVAAVVVVAVLVPSVAGITPARSGPVPSLAPLATSLPVGGIIHVGAYPAGIAFDSVNDLLYVTNFGSSNISVVNATMNRVVAWIPMPYGIGTLAVDTATGVVYTADSGYTVYAVDPSSNTIGSTISLVGAGCPYGCGPEVQTYDAANGDIFVTDISANNVSVIHGATVVAAVPVGVHPNGAAFDSANGDVYVSNEGSSVPSINLTVIDGTANRVVGQVPGSGGGPGVTYDGSNGDVYVCENGDQINFSNLVTVVNGTNNNLVTSIPISSGCGGAVYDPNNGYVYVTDRYKPGGQYLSNVTIIDPDINRIVTTQPVQSGPIGIAYDTANHNVYVADSNTNNISILPQIYRLTVHETGLASGTNWSATVGGTTFSSTTSSITFPETNGTFNFTIGSVSNRSACPSSGNVTVAGGPREQNVTFSSSAGCGSPSGFLGFPGQTGYYVLGGITAVLVAAVVVVVVLTRRKRRARPSPTTSPPAGSPGQGP